MKKMIVIATRHFITANHYSEPTPPPTSASPTALLRLLPTVYSTDLLAEAGAPGQSPLSTPSDQ